MRRILIISQIFPSGLSGTSVKTRKTIEVLVNLDFAVDVCCLHHHSMIRNSFFMDNLRIFVVNKDIVSKISVKYIFKVLHILFTPLPFRIKKMFDSSLMEKIRTLKNTYNYSHIFYDGFSTLQYFEHSSQSKSKQIYIDDEDITVLMKERMNLVKNLFLKLFYFLEYIRSSIYEKNYFNIVDEIWAIAPNTMARFKKITNTKLVLMPTIVPKQLNCWSKKSSDIVFTGLLSWSENIDGLKWFLKEVWDEVLTVFPNTKLRVVGQMASETLIAELRLVKNVIYEGYVENLEEVYRNSRIAIAPIFINAGIKVKILTYLSYGLPTIAFKQSTWGMSETGGVMIATKKNFVSKTIKLLSDNQLCKGYSIRGYQNIIKHHSENNLRNFLKRVRL